MALSLRPILVRLAGLPTLAAALTLSAGPPLAVALTLAATLPATAGTAGQTEPNTAALEELSRRFEREVESRRTQLYRDLLASDQEPQASMNRNPDIQLMYIDDRGVPVFYGIQNLNAARTISTDDVWPGGGAGFSLSGSGTVYADLGVWDAGAVRGTHQELTGRTTQGDSPGATHWHATHVAGTMIAGGVNGSAKGMSYQGQLTAFDWTSDASEMATAAANGMEVSNHSYGLVAGWYWDAAISNWVWYGDLSVSTAEDYKFGFYDSVAQSWDQIAYNAPLYTIVKSSGNDHQEGPVAGTAHWHWAPGSGWVWSSDTHDLDGGTDGFDSIPTYGVAKNVITVGAVKDVPGGWTQPSDAVILGFSSRGFPDDGRIKPDLVANGENVYSCTDAGNGTYANASGTSMATPNVTGSVNLLVRHYVAAEGGLPLASAMKAILIQTADEAGPNPGPDYVYGWGLMNTQAAAQLIQGAAAGHVYQGQVDNGTVHELLVYLPAAGPFRATMCWTDPAGTPPSPSLNPTTPMLVNDLDLRVESLNDGTIYLPWTLDPTNPGNAATTGDNTLDNVEQIYSASLPAGGYKITVTHKGTLASSQVFSLVCSEGMGIASYSAYADHNVGNVVLSMTDQGSLGFRDDTQAEGSGFIFPAGGSNLVYIGGLWVSEGDDYVANRDYSAEPEKEWTVSAVPDGHLRVDYDGISDQDIRAGFTDGAASSPRDLYVRQESWAWSGSPDEDFVIVRYIIENTGASTRTDLYAGTFMDYDLGTYTSNTGAVDAARSFAYVTDTSGVHAGLQLIRGDVDPDAVGNLTLIHNPTYVWPQNYVLDADKLAFLQASDPDHVLSEGTSPDDYGVLASVGPFDLASGETNEVVFAILGGAGLADLETNANRAQILYATITWGSADVAPDFPGPEGTRLLPNAPNPFRSTTTVRFQLQRPAAITLAVHDAQGRRIRLLAQGTRDAGSHALIWDGRDEAGRTAASGVYFLRLLTEGGTDSGRIIRLR
jgi:hypothetical protein